MCIRDRRCTTGYAVFASYLLGESDGIAKTAEWAAEICGVNAEKIRERAAIFHQNTTMLMAGWGMQRQQFGEQKHWMIVTLAAMLGQIGTPGGGFGPVSYTHLDVYKRQSTSGGCRVLLQHRP